MPGTSLLNAHFLVALILSVVVANSLMRHLPAMAIRIGLVDQPDDRKTHQGAIPLVGGVAMFVAFTLAVLLIDSPVNHLRGLFAGALLLVVVGVLDDLHELSSVARFIAQILAAIIMAEWGNVRLVDLGWISPAGELVNLNWWSSLLTIFATVGVINAVNMIDGIDGLAGSLCMVAALSMAGLAWLGGDGQSAQVLIILSATLAVYLFYNRAGHLRIFMGDAGSMFLGLVLCWYFVRLSQGPDRIMAPVTALWIFFVPLFDTVAQMFRRILAGKSPFDADRRHVHHLLARRGYSETRVLVILLAISVTCALTGIAAEMLQWSQAVMFYSFLGLFALYFTLAYYGAPAWRWFNRTG